MDEAVTQEIASGIVQGGFAALGDALSLGFTSDVGAIAALDESVLGAVLGSHPISIEASVSGGSAIVLLTVADATKLASLSESGEATPGDTLSDDAAGLVGTLFTAFIGASLQSEAASAHTRTVDDAAKLLSLLGEDAASTEFTFSADPHFQSTGHLLTSAGVQLKGDGDDPLVSDEEMQDILSGFTPDQEGGYGGEGMPENIDVIMGIDLTATARLGKVEMPIGEVLNMGPGSILEVGHLVDEPVELLINGRLIARGDVVVVDEKFGLRITEIISPQERIESLG